MKNPQAHLSDAAAKKQLKQFMIAGWIIAVAAFFVLPYMAIASAAFGGRCIALSWHKANASRPNGKWLKVGSIAMVVLSLVDLTAVFA